MKTKLMVLALMAGGSMFAATRFSVGVSVGQPACATPAYNSSYSSYGYVAPAYSAPYSYGYSSGYGSGYGYNNRYQVRDRRDWDRDDRWRGNDRDNHWRVRNDYRGDSRNGRR